MDERPKASLKIDTEGYDEVENMKFEMNLLNQKENQNKGMPSSTRNDNNNKKNQPGENEETGKKSNRSDGQNQTTKVDSSSKNKEIGFESTKDLRREDKTKRTVFHRAALEQNANLLRALCEKIKTENRVEYIEKEDIFANTPLICACMQNIEGQERNRLDCIKILLEFSANARAQNRRTRWSALNWCAYHGDDACISKLLDSNAEPYLPDYDGLFPIDIAGQMKKKEVVLLLFQKLLELFEEYEDYKIKHPEKVNSKYVDDKNIYLQSIQLRTSCLYWGIKYNAPHKKLNRFLQLNNVIPEMPMHQDYMRNCFHASCEENEIDILKTLYHFRDDKKKIDIPNKIFEIKENEMNKQFYSKKFLGHWKKLGSWLTDFQKTLNEGQDVRAFEDQDFYGNSPLHIASFKGYDNCAEFLLDKGNHFEY